MTDYYHRLRQSQKEKIEFGSINNTTTKICELVGEMRNVRKNKSETIK